MAKVSDYGRRWQGYLMPTRMGKPGPWHTEIDPVLCFSGWHVLMQERDITPWIRHNCLDRYGTTTVEVWEVEVAGQCDRGDYPERESKRAWETFRFVRLVGLFDARSGKPVAKAAKKEKRGKV
jgi:hypothetical protein